MHLGRTLRRMKRSCSPWAAIIGIGIGIGIAIAVAIGFRRLIQPIAFAIPTPIPIPTFLAFCFYFRDSQQSPQITGLVSALRYDEFRDRGDRPRNGFW